MRNYTLFIKNSFWGTLLFMSTLFSTQLQAQCNPANELIALEAFYNATNGVSWTSNHNWLIETDISTWQGIEVNNDGCVTKIALLFNNLQGTLPPEIGNFPYLEVLDIGWNNALEGSIPPTIGNLSNLESLKLQLNGLSGPIPSGIGNLGNLFELNLSNNELTGDIPPEIGSIPNLQFIFLDNNELSGGIPPEIGNLTNLDHLGLSSNQLTGIIPPELTSLSLLSWLDLTQNELTGNIPTSIGDLDKLENLFLHGNNLTGSIPPSIGDITFLRSIQLSDNALTGNIPPEIGNLDFLVNLNLRTNELEGNIPDNVSNLSSLKWLDLSYNQLTGSIPSGIGNLNNLKRLSLTSNQLNGEIPAELYTLINLEELHLFNNQLTGIISAEIANLINLQEASLAYNQLTGTIPPELGSLSNLEVLAISHNQLTGIIPPELGNLINLEDLGLAFNQLTGVIPTEFENLTSLETLDLANNQLTGTIPPELGNTLTLNYLDLSFNQLTGTIPPGLGNLTALRNFNLSSNQLTGALPIELANLENLHTLFLSSNQLTGCIPPQYNIFCSIPNLAFYFNPGLPNGGDFDAFCSDNFGACGASITGKVIVDENENCTAEDTETGLRNWIIKASSAEGDFYGITDSSGCYSIYTYEGDYTVALEITGPYWDESCTGIATANVDGIEVDTVNFFPNALIECPLLTVDVSTALMRRCFNNTYVVQYCNYGTTAAEDTYIEVTLDELLTVDMTSIPISEQLDNTYTFNLGDISINECGTFYIETTLSCQAILGQTICAEAHIYPDSTCIEPPTEWSGATVSVEGTCDGDQVHFIIENIGEDMLSERTYFVIEDGIILMQEPVPFILNSNNEIELNYPANGSTYTLQAIQVENHPLESMPIAFVEACGTNAEGNFSTGFVTQFPEDDDMSFISIDCQEAIGAYDPNDKRGYPKGYGEEHFIEREQDLEYHIRFQNTGTDTAFTVIVEDVLSPNLDISSLRLGTSSHTYSVEIKGSDTLRFIYDNILLPDSIINEVASHGFVKFKISQKADLPLGTQITNSAGIYFDFNDPVITNTTIHTLGEQFITVSTKDVFLPNLKVSLAPNPVSDEAMLRINGVTFKNAQFKLYNITGVLLKETSFDDNELSLKRENLNTGIYFFEIIIDGKKGYIGKMIID